MPTERNEPMLHLIRMCCPDESEVLGVLGLPGDAMRTIEPEPADER